mgnify:FL=1
MNKVNPRTLSGFMELSPNDQIEFNRIKKIIEDTYKLYGFYPLDTPVIEYSSVLLAKAGGETEKQIYRFNKGDNDLSLRFDLTVPLAKYVSLKYNELLFPFKRYQIGKVFRGERPQKGRFREFYQCDIDVIGDGELSLMYDAEIPSIIYDIFTKMNIGKFVIRINNRKILNGFFEYLNLSDKYQDILRIIDKMEKVSESDLIDMLKEIDLTDEIIDKILSFIKIKGTNGEVLNSLKGLNISNEAFLNGINELETVINSLRTMNINEEYFMIDLTIARGLDYYTGTVYETKLVDYPQMGSVCSGGRYDDLATFYTDKKLPGVGISIGLTRLFYQLKENGLIKNEDDSVVDVMILPMIEEYKVPLEISKKLRNIGISTSICYINKKFKSKIKYADSMNVKYSIIIGEDEINNNVVTIKDMYKNEQTQINIECLEEYFKNFNI